MSAEDSFTPLRVEEVKIKVLWSQVLSSRVRSEIEYHMSYMLPDDQEISLEEFETLLEVNFLRELDQKHGY